MISELLFTTTINQSTNRYIIGDSDCKKIFQIKERICWYCETRCVGLVAICKECRSKNMKK